ncbi:YbaK/EbsC family protein [Tateyamaria sp. Alg231-49]|uniref:YbaK/EbsC family protein n=1 Tax=Tateyamaria sp. Alg231-49 TaxID=1922219 RepID=UPI000D557F2C|nr:YbaK/EbsC family protein [Tateyamaria sp. Alg231-49]
MSKSLKRVRSALEAAGVDTEIRETPLARTAADAANAIGCEIDQIAKSIIFRGENSCAAILFITAGGNQVDPEKAAHLAGEPLGKADASLIRTQTGFAIGGVSPVGHLSPITAFFDPQLAEFPNIWAAAGTPHHVFRSNPQDLVKISGAQISDFKS